MQGLANKNIDNSVLDRQDNTLLVDRLCILWLMGVSN